MQIVHVCRLFTPHVGGVETHVEQVVRIQRERQHQVTIVTTQHDSTLPLVETRKDGIVIYRLPENYSLKKFQTWYWVLQHAALFRQADSIQVHDIFWWILPIYSQNRTKFITTFHGWETKWPIAKSARLQRQFINYLSAATVHVGDWIRTFYGDTPDEVLYGGVEDRFLQIPFPNTIQKKSIHVVFIGRLEVDIAVLLYIDFVSTLREHGVRVEMTWVGDGRLRSACERVGKVVGWQNDTVKWLRVSDFVCASSYLSILQAQAAGRVVISLYANKLKKMYLETYNGSHFSIVSDSSIAAAQRVQELVGKPKELRLLQTGAKNFAAGQTWLHVVDTYERLAGKTMQGKSTQ